MRFRLLSILLLAAAASASAQTTVSGSFTYGGINRTYSFYVPASYVPGQAVPLVLNLHGTGTDGAYQAQYRDFRPIADTANFIVVHPDGSTMLGQRFWNYGNVFGSTVDDVGFLEAVIDSISAHYSINPNRIYSAGMSNGSFMSYCLACESDRFAAIGAVTGSMSVSMYNSCNPDHPTPTIHVHGTSDNTNPYAGTSTMQGIDDVVAFWADQNGCNPTPAVIAVPNTNTGDNATADHYVYTGGINGHSTELFKVTGGGHTWPGSPTPGSSGNTCMDFDATKELWRFFSQYERAATTGLEEKDIVQLSIWPNPAHETLNIQAGDRVVTKVTIIDLQGRVVVKKAGKHIEQVDISHLQHGHYVVQVSGKDFLVRKKVLVD